MWAKTAIRFIFSIIHFNQGTNPLDLYVHARHVFEQVTANK